MENNQTNEKYNQKLIRKNIYETSIGRVCHESNIKPISDKTYRIKVSYDKFQDFLYNNYKVDLKYPSDIEIYDESFIIGDIGLDLRLRMLQKLNTMNINSIKFYLSDDMLYHYNELMSKINWKHSDKTELNLTIDRYPLRNKPNELNIQMACGKLNLTEDKLIWFSNHTLLNLNGRVSKKLIYDSINLKKVVEEYYEILNKGFDLKELTDYDKFLLTYLYVKDYLKIKFPGEFITIRNGKTERKAFSYAGIGEPYSTYLNKSGVCEGQAKLMNILLANPLIKVDSSVIVGECPLGGHAWVGANIDNKLYECCTTMKGIYKNLASEQYIPNSDDIYTRIYPRSYLNDEQKSEIEKHILKLKK